MIDEIEKKIEGMEPNTWISWRVGYWCKLPKDITRFTKRGLDVSMRNGWIAVRNDTKERMEADKAANKKIKEEELDSDCAGGHCPVR